jgi:tryptophan synthase alpha chain
MNLKQTLSTARTNKTSVFIPFIMAGDPSMEASVDIVLALEKAGAGAIELGVPFSEPVADGITVQRAHERALKNGATLKSVLELIKTLRTRGLKIPVCLFSYLNPVYKMGYENFATAATAAGANGALLVDLPPEEAEEYLMEAKKAGLETVFLCSPTTTPERLKIIDAASTGFVYYVARAGVTGTQDELPREVEEKLFSLKNTLSNPVAVGFGISRPEHVRSLKGKADGIVVGSALVKIVEENQNHAAEKVGIETEKMISSL